MPDIGRLETNLNRAGIQFQYFDTAQEAADYLNDQIDGVTVGIGGSMTVKELGLYPRLTAHNQVFWHWEGNSRQDAVPTEVYISSANALAETGEIINIDGYGNRISSTLYGHRRVYFVVGINKLAPDYDAALWRARNVAAPRRAQSMNKKTPCALKADRCYNCHSPERICRALSVLWVRPSSTDRMEVVLIGQELGF